MKGLHAGLTGEAVQFLQGQRGIANRRRDGRNNAIREGGVSFDRCIVYDFREPHALFGGGPGPGSASVQRQNVHLHAVLVHPFDALVEIGITG